ncbi:MAG: glutathione S-transferase N-terminal domain-containing protein [Minicystis sp.]
MKVYGHPMSTCTRKVLTVLAEKGHEADFQLVDLMTGQHKKDEHLARQPFGVIPVLEDGSFSLYESRAIIRYLDEKLPGPKLTPSNLQERALMEQWLSVEFSYFSGSAMKIVREMVFHRMMGQATDMDNVAKGRAEVSRVLDITEKTLAKQEFFGGKTFSLADISWMPYVQYLFAAESGDLITSRHGVRAWWERVSTRPSWKKVAG